jgi:hypothetical protein
MGLFTPFIYTNKKGKKFWLHSRQRGKAILYYFSKDPVGALKSLPSGYEVVENPLTGMPFLKKKESKGFFERLFGFSKTKERENKKPEKAEEGESEKKSEEVSTT